MFSSELIPYSDTKAFTRIVQDYLTGSESLRPFYAETPSVEGIRETIEKKKHQAVDRNKLYDILVEQYQLVNKNTSVMKNISLLKEFNSFTICTAHQPNLFTGPLYFIYKILHTIRLSQYLNGQLPDYKFIPVYYMGSEDADFAELNHTYVDGKRIEWKKEQGGAVGRMPVDQTLIRLIDELEGQLSQETHGKEVIEFLRKCYSLGKNIQTATFELVNELYGDYGLVVVIPDQKGFKWQMKHVFRDDLLQHTPSSIVRTTSEKLETNYDAQAYPRDINLFYLKDHIRERIEFTGEKYKVLNSNISFTKNEVLEELEEHPERFSPNVILRGLFQETILPNLVFVGGGGELAYWLQLKDLFHHYRIVYPVLVLRNSFLIVDAKWSERIKKTGLSIQNFFSDENTLMKKLIEKHSEHEVKLNGNLERMDALFEQISGQAQTIDPTLTKHVAAIRARSVKYLEELEKKMFRAEKRKYSDQQQQIKKIREVLFPRNGLQERVENFSSFYARWGKDFIKELMKHSLALEQKFAILTEKTSL
ncbi:MAG: bacillithiol biosynthesis cysteine-adding enzyme BshC [Flavisolibacter sp.]